ncbi:MAG: TetR/AcrR family transcriptional regulator [Verrucomicrobiaceae bacterium]|nr:MAG: TetR/AcrR family transcriptional regulator [Verrucomicrobiaceae bacterium]
MPPRFKTSPPPQALLDAAEAVALRDGVARLTFDAVAAEAGMSKGGVLHHFASKEQLIEAMVRRTAEEWRECYMSAYESTPEGPGRMARGILSHCLMGDESWTEPLRRRFSCVLAALAQNPSLVQSMRETYSDIYTRLEHDGLPPGTGEAIGAAIDGIWLSWAMRFCDVEADFLSRIHRVLSTLLEQALSQTATADQSNTIKES